ncbi:pyridoxamine 5'-phosphate oxidase family protein [Oscillatoria sp. FACHB-1406]|uniref:HugZ family pyridoxamine 5'-phosphate oxidase n=1 Tax=Oscillatoria sp. FACHB-1406 TaxID=2692846 RepID=UPI001688DFBC|nr:pyridoxamine 5'-phosphate oxidase family protein [Oscillatoria sp. FACHB-1406]MBD2576217.1 pyridoxamine 5'-phosphate oxidase family protein [Oscillatoria sp. FACHB-1406]
MTNKLEETQAEYQQFAREVESLILGTVDLEGVPDTSYAPFVSDEARNFYIYVSGLSTHTQNLENNPRASLLLIEDESKARQIFARRRLSYNCTATLLPRDTSEWEAIVTLFQSRFGDIIEMFRSLPDFRIFKLVPQSGRFVVGFGAAYRISSDNLDRLIQMGE